MARILIAEDDAHIARVMSIWLSRHGHDSISVTNGRQALTTIQSQPVDLVISDMNMPELDGLGLVRELRRGQPIHQQLPVMILSARCDQHELMETLSSYGVCVYPKPFLPSHMVAEIHRLLGVAGLPQAEPAA